MTGPYIDTCLAIFCICAGVFFIFSFIAVVCELIRFKFDSQQLEALEKWCVKVAIATGTIVMGVFLIIGGYALIEFGIMLLIGY